jgi:hypothetical protein
MSEEQEEVAEPEAEPEPEQTTDHVDMDDGTQKRFNRIYGNMKQYERVVSQMGKENRALLDRLDKLEGAQYENEVSSAIDNLKKDKVSALDEGNHDVVADIDDKIAQIRAIPEPQPTLQAPDPQYQLSNEDNQLIATWGAEVGTDGQYKRPWAQAGHPYNTKAAAIGAAVLEDTAIASQGTEAILAEVDRLMGVQTAPLQRTSPVMTNDASVSQPKAKVGKATGDEKQIAAAMGISVDRYMKSKQEIQNAP